VKESESGTEKFQRLIYRQKDNLRDGEALTQRNRGEERWKERQKDWKIDSKITRQRTRETDGQRD